MSFTPEESLASRTNPRKQGHAGLGKHGQKSTRRARSWSFGVCLIRFWQRPKVVISHPLSPHLDEFEPSRDLPVVALWLSGVSRHCISLRRRPCLSLLPRTPCLSPARHAGPSDPQPLPPTWLARLVCSLPCSSTPGGGESRPRPACQPGRPCPVRWADPADGSADRADRSTDRADGTGRLTGQRTNQSRLMSRFLPPTRCRPSVERRFLCRRNPVC